MSVIDDLLAKTEPPQRRELERVHRIVKRVCPECTEVVTYGMPGFKYKNKYLLSFAAFKNHMSIFPGAEPIELLKDKLQNYKLAKGTIRFTIDTPLPESTIVALVEICMARVAKF